MSELYNKLIASGDKFSAWVLACYENSQAKQSSQDNK